MSMIITFFIVVIAFANIYTSSATYGVDVSQRTTVSSWSCLKSNGYNFGIVRVYQSNGQVDPNGSASINDAWTAGIAHVDGYIFPCYSCGNPAGQIDATINSLQMQGIKIKNTNETDAENNVGLRVGMLWIDVEGTQYWSSSTSNNVNFIQAMVNEGKARGISLGMYTSNSQWSPITGGSTAFKSLPLWYPHYDNNPSYSDWVSFGGWTQPSIKQYCGTTSICSTGIDKNFY